MIRPCAQYTGSKKEILRTSEKKRFPVRAAVIQYVPAGTCRLENSHCDGQNHGVTVNCVRSLSKFLTSAIIVVYYSCRIIVLL